MQPCHLVMYAVFRGIPGIPEYSGVFRGIPEYSGVFRSIVQDSVFPGIPEYSRVFRSIPGYPGVFQGISEYSRVFRSIPAHMQSSDGLMVFHSIPKYSDSGGPQFKELFPPRSTGSEKTRQARLVGGVAPSPRQGLLPGSPRSARLGG